MVTWPYFLAIFLLYFGNIKDTWRSKVVVTDIFCNIIILIFGQYLGIFFNVRVGQKLWVFGPIFLQYFCDIWEIFSMAIFWHYFLWCTSRSEAVVTWSYFLQSFCDIWTIFSMAIFWQHFLWCTSRSEAVVTWPYFFAIFL